MINISGCDMAEFT
jgi:hypothetical protein